MKVVFLHQTIAKHDATGNDIAHMYSILGRKYCVFVYCDYLENPGLNKVNREHLFDIISDRRNLLVYHHSTYWEEGEKILAKAKAKIIIRYHNITPPSYFLPYYEDYYIKCKEGRKQTARLYKKYPNSLWMGASSYNLEEAGIGKDSNKVVVPPFNNIEQWKHVSPNEEVLKSILEGPELNLLFVGRIAPNKGHKFLLHVVRDYLIHYNEKIVLHIVGKRDENLGDYNRELDDLRWSSIPQSSVNWAGQIEDSVMLAYYLGCDFYLNCSDHEGFCVPIVEAQSLYLPVITKHSSGITETIGKQQLILEEDPAKYSAAIHILSKNATHRDFLIENGFRNYWSRFRNSIIENSFIRAIQEYMGISE